MNQYTILIKNATGAGQEYALFQSAPVVNPGGVSPKIWSNVFAVAAAPKGENANFTMYNQYYAVVGSSLGKPGDAVTVSTSMQVAVKLGSTNPDGTLSAGTTLALEIDKIGNLEAPTFSSQTIPNSGVVNAFSITTPAFNGQDAINNNWLIGLGGADPTGMNFRAITATFVPQPQVTYQIQPQNTYWVIPGTFNQNAIFDYTAVGNKVEIDFTKFLSGQVTIVHDATGSLTIQAQ